MLLRAHIIAWYKKFAFSSKYPTSLRGGGDIIYEMLLLEGKSGASFVYSTTFLFLLPVPHPGKTYYVRENIISF